MSEWHREEELDWVSDWWYILPIFFGVIGGLVAFAINFDRDGEKAMHLLILGIVVSVLEFIFLAFHYGWIFW